MGWIFNKRSRDDLVRELLLPTDNQRMSTVVLKHELVCDTLWTLVRIVAKESGVCGLSAGARTVIIRSDQLQSDGLRWGYVSRDESDFPLEFSCPLEFLSQAPVRSKDWRDAVRRFHDQGRHASR